MTFGNMIQTEKYELNQQLKMYLTGPGTTAARGWDTTLSSFGRTQHMSDVVGLSFRDGILSGNHELIP